MPGIRTRITGKAERAELHRKAKGRHPLLKIGSRHNSIFQTILQDGNHKGGITASEIRHLNENYHPQILKDLLDHRLIKSIAKQDNNAFRYVADPAAKGSYVQEVTVEVELLEDEFGRFFTRTYLEGRHPTPGRIVRSLGSRKLHFKVPLPNEPEVTPIQGDARIDANTPLTRRGGAQNAVIDAEAEEYREPLLLEATATRIED
jgi:hypothetical protein